MPMRARGRCRVWPTESCRRSDWTMQRCWRDCAMPAWTYWWTSPATPPAAARKCWPSAWRPCSCAGWIISTPRACRTWTAGSATPGSRRRIRHNASASACTTCRDALWMGLPVVTLPGWSAVSRQTASLLWRLRRPQWVANDVDAYVAQAVALASQVETLRPARLALRAEVEHHLCDSRRQAREFAALFARLTQDLGMQKCNNAPELTGAIFIKR